MARQALLSRTSLRDNACCVEKRKYVKFSLLTMLQSGYVNSVTSGIFWNGGEFYGPTEYNSLVLVERYLERYPEHSDKIFLSIKGGLKPGSHEADGSPENTRRSLDECIAQLKGRKKIDSFEFARRDANVPLDVTFGVINKEYIDTGKIGGISLSEVRAETIHDAVKHTKVISVEAELSL